jgi:hypothetical protein
MITCQICQIPDAGAPVFPVDHAPNPDETIHEANHVDHNYHVECLEGWLETSGESNCPACARRVSNIGNHSLQRDVLAFDETHGEQRNFHNNLLVKS